MLFNNVDLESRIFILFLSSDVIANFLNYGLIDKESADFSNLEKSIEKQPDIQRPMLIPKYRFGMNKMLSLLRHLIAVATYRHSQ